MNAELHVTVGAYALDALEEREQIAFEQHLAGCPVCAGELAEFQDTAARLATAMAVPPPPEMRTAVLEAVARTTQDRPLIQLHRGSKWRQRLPVLVAAAAVLAVVGAVGAYVGERDRLSDLEAANSQEAAVLAADDAVLSQSRRGGEGSVKVWSSESIGQAVVVTAGVPPLEPSRSYQMWAIQADGEPRSLDVWEDEGPSDSASHLVGPLDDASRVALTIEPEGGSPAPTTRPFLAVELG